ncbi:MAG: ribonuclease P protein component [Gemmatimonadales bacterium]
MTAGGQHFPRARRLSRRAELERVQRTGRRRRLLYVDVWWTDNQAGHPRLGLIVPKFQFTGVARNRLRRRLREIWRRELSPELPAWDVLVRARKEAYEARFAELRRELHRWWTSTASGEQGA